MACLYSQLVVICLKNGEFEKAKEILTKHFSCGMMGKVLYLFFIYLQMIFNTYLGSPILQIKHEKATVIINSLLSLPTPMIFNQL